jgi:DNA-binding CsgD family transcriptional regulator
MNDAAPQDGEFIDLIYAALLGEAPWEDFLDRLSRSLPGGKTTLFHHDVRKARGAWELSSGLGQDVVAEYARHYSRLNPWMPAASVRKIGQGVVAEQMLPREEFVKTEFYNDFFRREIGESAVGVTIVREHGCSFLLSTTTSRADPDANRDAADRLTRLAPHLQRAFRHFRRNSRQRAIEDIGVSLFDAIDVGLVIVGDARKLKAISATGQRMVESGCGVGVTPLGLVKNAQADADAMLARMLDRGFSGANTAAFVVGQWKLTLIRLSQDRISAYFDGPTVVMLIERPAAKTRVGVEYFANTHRLTAAEKRALEGLVSGKRISEIADDAMLSRETIRSQVKSVFAKTGASSQIELIRLAGSMNPN